MMLRSLAILSAAVVCVVCWAQANTAELPAKPVQPNTAELNTQAPPPASEAPVVNAPGVVTLPKGMPMPSGPAPTANAPASPPATATQAPPPMPARPNVQAPALPKGGVPAVTLPNQGGAPGQQAGGPPQEKKTPKFEITAVEATKSGAKAALEERLRPYKGILDKLQAGDNYSIVNQETHEAPFGVETEWSISPEYSAFILPMDLTQEGAVKLDARVAMNSGGKQLNALRAEGEVPSGKVMAFRGLSGPNGGEMLLFLRQKNDDKDGGGDNQQQQQDDQQDQQKQEDASSGDAKSDQEKQQQEKDSQEEKKDNAEQEKDKTAKMAEDMKKDEQEPSEGSEKEEKTIEALLDSLEEEDQRQQQEARFDRKKITLPPSGEWW